MVKIGRIVADFLKMQKITTGNRFSYGLRSQCWFTVNLSHSQLITRSTCLCVCSCRVFIFIKFYI